MRVSKSLGTYRINTHDDWDVALAAQPSMNKITQQLHQLSIHIHLPLTAFPLKASSANEMLAAFSFWLPGLFFFARGIAVS